MKHTLITLFGCTMAASATTLVINEQFNYDNGPLDGLSGGSGFSGAWETTVPTSGNYDAYADFLVVGGTVSSTPSGSSYQNQTLSSSRAFNTAIGPNDTITFSIDFLYEESKGEGQFAYFVELVDSNAQVIASLGLFSNAGGVSSNNQYGLLVGDQSSLRGGTNSTSFHPNRVATPDTLTVSLDFSGGQTVNGSVSSTLFGGAIDGSFTASYVSAPDFSAGGSVVIRKDLLDSNKLSVDNITLTTTPVPESSALLIGGLGFLGLLRRRR